MSDYIVHLDSKVKSLSSHFRDMQVRRNAIESDRTRLQTQRIQLMGKHTALLKRVSLLTSSQETLKRLVDELSKDGIIALESMFSDALKTVFDDRNYSMKIEISERGNNKTADFILVENVNGVSLETNVRDSIGAGVMTVIGVVIRVYFIMTLNLKRFLVMDESIYALSTQYLENFFTFLGNLKEIGFSFLIISHDPRAVEFADKVYSVDKGKVKEISNASKMP